MNITDKQRKKLEKMLKVTSAGGTEKDLEIVDMIADLEDKIDDAIANVQMKEPTHGIDGEDYVLTEEDKDDIASKIIVPVVEKIIEKTETIIRETPKETITERIIEKPIVTNITKEVAVLDVNSLAQYGEKYRDGLELLQEDDRINLSAVRGISVSPIAPVNPKFGDIWIQTRA